MPMSGVKNTTSTLNCAIITLPLAILWFYLKKIDKLVLDFFVGSKIITEASLLSYGLEFGLCKFEISILSNETILNCTAQVLILNTAVSRSQGSCVTDMETEERGLYYTRRPDYWTETTKTNHGTLQQAVWVYFEKNHPSSSTHNRYYNHYNYLWILRMAILAQKLILK